MPGILTSDRIKSPDLLLDAAERQIEALALLAQGYSIKDIASEQSCSYNTAKETIANLMLGLEAGNKAHAVRRGHELGLLTDIPISSRLKGNLEDERLTPQQERILTLVSMAFSYAEIGSQLGFTAKNANTHMVHVTRKLGTNTLAHTVHAAAQLELIEVEANWGLINDWQQFDC